ncbi:MULTISPECIES: hypothetical protein [Streptomyces]|uniref:hypothetical protein n=1 Tax=Streptomyces TaxID=1883 RepID=UPI0035DC49A2
MRPEPQITFAADARHGLVARSGWEQEEARAVLRELGWEWEEHLHAQVPPDDVAASDAGVQAVLELHQHGYLTGHVQGPFGTMRIRLAEADRVFMRMTAETPHALQRAGTPPAGSPQPAVELSPPSYADRHAANIDNESPGGVAPRPEL